jgi:MFS family permease
MAFLGVAVWGVFTAALSGPARTVLQRATPERAHGRVMATDMLAANATMLLGSVLAGPLIGAFGVPWTISGVAVVAVVVGLSVLDRAGRGAEQAGVAVGVAEPDPVDAQ